MCSILPVTYRSARSQELRGPTGDEDVLLVRLAEARRMPRLSCRPMSLRVWFFMNLGWVPDSGSEVLVSFGFECDWLDAMIEVLLASESE